LAVVVLDQTKGGSKIDRMSYMSTSTVQIYNALKMREVQGSIFISSAGSNENRVFL